MGIFTRIARLCKSDLHGVMDQLEDKHLLLKQYLREMEDDLKQKKARLTLMGQTARDMERDLQERQQSIGRLEADLNLAVTRDKDDIARMLIRKRRTLEAGCIRLQHRLDRLAEEQGALQEKVERQTLQYEQLKVNATAFEQQAEQQRTDGSDVFDDAPLQWATPSDEEIELELLQRKEDLKSGGES